VRNVIGRVKNNNIGLRKAFSIPRIAAAKNADKKLPAYIPLIKYDVIRIANVRTNHLRKRLFMLKFPPLRECAGNNTPVFCFCDFPELRLILDFYDYKGFQGANPEFPVTGF
jgi:hypothetical protein